MLPEWIVILAIALVVGVVVWILTTEPKDNHKHVPILNNEDEAHCRDCGEKLQWSEDGQWV